MGGHGRDGSRHAETLLEQTSEVTQILYTQKCYISFSLLCSAKKLSLYAWPSDMGGHTLPTEDFIFVHMQALFKYFNERLLYDAGHFNSVWLGRWLHVSTTKICPSCWPNMTIHKITATGWAYPTVLHYTDLMGAIASPYTAISPHLSECEVTVSAGMSTICRLMGRSMEGCSIWMSGYCYTPANSCIREIH